ncbi:hypothetical protein ES705_49452 [subsurface metagenome]
MSRLNLVINSKEVQGYSSKGRFGVRAEDKKLTFSNFKLPFEERTGNERLRSLQISLSRTIFNPKDLSRRGDFISSFKKMFLIHIPG